MTDEKDPLDSEISGSVTVTDSGVEAKLKSRTASAIDRLCGNVVDYLNLPVEAKTSRKRAIQTAEVAIIEATAKVMVARIESDPKFAERMMEKHFQSIVRKQLNKDAVIEIAVEEIKKLPPPDVAELKGAADSVDDDWLNLFESLAEKASTERMRQLFGKILSGEIRKPGAFSFTTLRIASELDQRTAQIFQTVTANRVDSNIPFHHGQRQSEDYLDLEVAGLINYSNGILTHSLPKMFMRRRAIVGSEYVAILGDVLSQEPISFPILRLTRTGVELARLLPNDELAALTAMIKGSPGTFGTTIHKRLPNEPGKLGFDPEPLVRID